MEIVFSAALFFLILIIFELIYSLFSKPESRSVNSVAERYSTSLQKEKEIDILYRRKFSEIKVVDAVLAAIPAVAKLDELMQQGGVKMLAAGFIYIVLIFGASFFLISSSLQAILPMSIAVSCVGAMMPIFYLLYKRRKRRSQFETLFPDALDLMGYSLKAGHSILASFKMVAEEMADPIGEEFNRVVEEINFGRDLDSSLRNFSRRIDSSELKFFVTAVVIQRETGGNLVEMLEKISEVVRRKFRFREKVRTLAAEGKLSAIILLALPFFSGAAIFLLNPEYIMVLQSDPAGPYAITIALIMMTVGSLIMYRLVQLDM